MGCIHSEMGYKGNKIFLLIKQLEVPKRTKLFLVSSSIFLFFVYFPFFVSMPTGQKPQAHKVTDKV